MSDITLDIIESALVKSKLAIDSLVEENKRLREALEIVTLDLEEEIENHYSVYDISKGDNKRKYERDIANVLMAKDILNGNK